MASPAPAEIPGPNSAAEPTTRVGRFNHEVATFEVEGVVHRVCRYGFERWSNSHFNELFPVRQDAEDVAGDTLENPIKLTGCTNEDFESLVEVMYPLEPQELPTLSKEKWVGVLGLARLWDMPKIAGLAIKELSKVDLKPVEKIKLGKDYGVPTWLKEGYTILVDDLSKASLADMTPLGWETAFRILWARDEIARSQATTKGGYWVDEDMLYCSYCVHYSGRNDAYKAKGGIDRCPRGHMFANNTGYWVPKESLNSTPALDPDQRAKVAADKVLEVFQEELKVAEDRNANTPSL